MREPRGTSTWIGTCHAAFVRLCLDELERLAPIDSVVHLGPGVFRFRALVPRAAWLAKTLAEEPIFLRHQQPSDVQLQLSGEPSDLAEIARAATALAAAFDLSKNPVRLGVQARWPAGVRLAYSPYAVKEAVDGVLASDLVEPVVRAPDVVVSVYVEPASSGWVGHVGMSRAIENLSDWSGGQVRFRHGEEAIARAHFKLAEALDWLAWRHPGVIPLAADPSPALDLGAAPGGWTAELLARGCRVTAVDTGTLDPALLAHPRVRFVRANALALRPGDPRLEPRYQWMTCDINREPGRMFDLVTRLAPLLAPGGLAVVTVKLLVVSQTRAARGNRRSGETPPGPVWRILSAARRELGRAFSVLTLKQLAHNRREVTAFLARPKEEN